MGKPAAGRLTEGGGAPLGRRAYLQRIARGDPLGGRAGRRRGLSAGYFFYGFGCGLALIVKTEEDRLATPALRCWHVEEPHPLYQMPLRATTIVTLSSSLKPYSSKVRGVTLTGCATTNSNRAACWQTDKSSRRFKFWQALKR